MNLRSILNDHGVPNVGPEHAHGRDGWIQVDCPDCAPGSQRFYLGINVRFGYANCWRCGRKTLTEVIQSLTHLPYNRVRELLRGFVPEKVQETRRPASLLRPKGLGELGPSHLEYLRSRGLDAQEVARLWSLRGIGLAPKLSWRVYIPIFFQGREVSWTTRAIGSQGKPRYISCEEKDQLITHNHLIYGADFCRNAVIAVEGPGDAWNVGPGAGATLGLSYSTAQLAILSRFPVRVICFDNEPDAQRRAKRLCTELMGFEGTTHNVQLDAEDPGSASPKEIRKLRKAFL